MKARVAPWKRRAYDVVITAVRKWRPNLQWRLSPPSPRSDLVRLTVSDAHGVEASGDVNLRLVERGSRRRDFSHVNDCGTRLLDEYYSIHEARADRREREQAQP